MPRDSSGTYTRVLSYVGDATGPVRRDMDPARFDQDIDDIAAELSNSATRQELQTLAQSVTGAVPWSAIPAFARTLIDDASAAEARTTLGLGTAATQNATAFILKPGDTGIGPLEGQSFKAPTLMVADGAKTWSLAAGTATFRLQFNGTDMLRFAENGSAQTIRDGTGNYRQLYHEGNLNPVKTVNGVTPDAAGNVAVATSGSNWLNLGSYGDITVTATELLIRTGRVNNGHLASAPARTVKGNMTGAAASPVDVPLNDVTQGMLSDAMSLDTIRVAATRPLVPYRATAGTQEQVLAEPTFAHGAAATLEIWSSVNNGVWFVAASGPNDTALIYNIATTNAYKVRSRVSYGSIVGPMSEVLVVSVGGTGDVGGHGDNFP